MNKATTNLRPARLPIPSDLSVTTDEQIVDLLESWRFRGAPCTWDEIIGHEDQKDALIRLASLLRISRDEPERLEAMGIRTGFGGAVICGPSGTGKSLLGRAFATAIGADRAIWVLPVSEMTPELLTRVFSVISSLPAGAIFMDEAERIIGQYAHLGADDELRVAFLSALDGIDRPSSGGSVTIALTTLENDGQIHPACIRPGRLSPVLTLSLPSLVDRRRLLETEIDRRPTDQVDAAKLADLTSGWTGAELAGLLEEAAIRSVVSGQSSVTMAACEQVAGERFVLGDRSAGLEPTEIMAIHESGHACHAAVAFSVEAVVEVRLSRTGGHTDSVRGIGDDLELRRELSPSVQVYATREELRSQLIGTLCGMMAEQVLLGEVTTGANHDRAAATQVAGVIVGLDAAAHFGTIEHSVGEYPVGPDALREDRWRAMDALLTECRGEAERFVARHANAIRGFAAELFSAPGQRLNGDELHAALRSALAIA